MTRKFLPIIFDIETTGLNPQYDEVIVIGYSKSNLEKPRIFPRIRSERKIINSFIKDLEKWRNKYEDICLVGYNIRRFDIEFLIKRASHYGLVFPELPVIDLIDIAGKYVRKRYPKLIEVAEYFNIPYDKEVSGKEVPELWKLGERGKVISHCEKDVLTELQLFLKVEMDCKVYFKKKYGIDVEFIKI